MSKNNENNFTLDGVEYVAVAVASGCGDHCSKCDLYNGKGKCLKVLQSVGVDCLQGNRKDGREVIFKKKVNLEMEQEK